jgi:predicted ATP-binding protein involved in virulence
MKVQSIRIKKLFGLFDYNIELNNIENMTILTGPNGYGKTTVLNILYNLFNQRFFYFQKLNFETISVSFEQNRRIDVTKKKGIMHQNAETTDIHLGLHINNKQEEDFVYNFEFENRLAQELRRFYPVRQLTPDLWLDDRTGKQISINEFLNENSAQLPECIITLIKSQGDNRNTQIMQVLNETSVYLIKEQRLLKQAADNQNVNSNSSFVNTIEEYAKELRKLIEQKQLEAYQIAQQLDSSFPKRLIEYKGFLSEREFNYRFAKLTKKLELLKAFGIATTIQDVPEYNNETKNVLTVYLEDSEKKIRAYDGLLNKIELFVNIMNEKEFTFKSIAINGARGFYFQSDNGQILNLADLSAGEQQEVVLKYELLFKTNPDTLILIDEPETSLHVMWQKFFIPDLQDIARMKRISFLISTHAPQIISDRWDLVRDLFDLAKKED